MNALYTSTYSNLSYGSNKSHASSAKSVKSAKSQGSNMSHHSLKKQKLPRIYECSSETGLKELIDRKEFIYSSKIRDLQKRIADMLRISSLTKSDIENTKKKDEFDEMEQMRRDLENKRTMVESMEKKENELQEVLNIMIAQERTLSSIAQQEQLPSLNQHSLNDIEAHLLNRIKQKKEGIQSLQSRANHLTSFRF